MSGEGAHSEHAAARGLVEAGDFWPGPVTPLLAKGGSFDPAHRGELTAGVEGVIARFCYRGEGGGLYTYNAVFARIPASQQFVPRLLCDRKGRLTDTVHYGFEVRSSRLWTESEVLNRRYEVKVSPFQDDNWLRQLFSPTFVDVLASVPPADFSFELAYGSLLCTVEEDDPGLEGLTTLWDAAAAVAARIRDESHE